MSALLRTIILSILLLPFVWLLVAVAVYIVRTVLGTAPIDTELAKRGRSALIGHTLRQGFAWMMRPIEQAFLDRGITPDTLTCTGLAICCAGSIAIAAGDLLLGGLLVLESSAFDFLDGRIARRIGSSSARGEFLDSTLDRYSDAFCFGGAAFLLRDSPWSLVAALVALGAAGIVPYARAKAEALGSSLKSGLMQRPERVVLFSGAAIFGPLFDGLWPAWMQDGHPTFTVMIWILAAATTATALSRTRDGLRMLGGRN